jgi:hypothetical protein
VGNRVHGRRRLTTDATNFNDYSGNGIFGRDNVVDLCLAAAKSHLLGRERGSFDPTVNSFVYLNLLILLAAGVGFESATVGCHCDLCAPQFESKIANDDFVTSYG